MSGRLCLEGCTCGKHSSPNRGRWCSKECECGLHKGNSGRKCEEGCECGRHGGIWCSKGCTCGRHSLENSQKISQAGLGRKHSEETKRKQSQSHLGIPKPPRSSEHIANLSKAGLITWQRPEYVQTQMRARGVVPNRLELAFAELIGWQFVGDGQLVIGGKCPDFWDGETDLIELYGDYWHRGQDPQERIDFFAQYGYTCQVIWEHELVDDIEQALIKAGVI